VRDGVLAARKVSATLSLSFRLPDGRRITPQSSLDLTEYYEALLAPTVHGAADPTPMANGYVWATEILEGLRVSDVLAATRMVYETALSAPNAFIEVTRGRTTFRAPWFYPEMVELIAELLRAKFKPWIVSASNVWSVRWMVQHGLNPLLRQHGVRAGLPPERVVGISTLLQDRKERFYKDRVLVETSPAYAKLKDRTTSGFRITSRLQFPVPTYSGKVSCIFDLIGGRPYLSVGDSPGDHAMLAFSRHRLWIERLDKPAFQRQLREVVRKTGKTGWLIQSVSGGDRCAFVPENPKPAAFTSE
jgi:hypothetical protein